MLFMIKTLELYLIIHVTQKRNNGYIKFEVCFIKYGMISNKDDDSMMLSFIISLIFPYHDYKK